MATSAQTPPTPILDKAAKANTAGSAAAAPVASGNGNSTGDGHAQPATDLMNRVVQGAHQTIDRLAEQAAPHVQRLQEGAHDANAALHNRAEQAREVGDEWAESLRCTVRQHPLAAVAAALAVGLLVAKLTR